MSPDIQQHICLSSDTEICVCVRLRVVMQMVTVARLVLTCASRTQRLDAALRTEALA